MTTRDVKASSAIRLAIALAMQGLALGSSVAQAGPPSTQATPAPKQRLVTSIDRLSGTIAPDLITTLAGNWDGTKLPVPLKLSDCADCADAAVRKALAAASVLGAVKGITKSNNGQYRLTGSDGGSLWASKDGVIEVSPGTLKFTRTLCYVVDFEHGQAKITVAVHGTHETREVAMIHIRPLAPADFEPITLGKLEPWIWERALTW